MLKKVWRDTIQRGKCDTRVKSIKSDSDEKKRSSVFQLAAWHSMRSESPVPQWRGASVFQEKINRGDPAELAETVTTKKGRHFFRKK